MSNNDLHNDIVSNFDDEHEHVHLRMPDRDIAFEIIHGEAPASLKHNYCVTCLLHDIPTKGDYLIHKFSRAISEEYTYTSTYCFCKDCSHLGNVLDENALCDLACLWRGFM